MKPKPRLHRLPGYDRHTGRWELLVFISIGFAGVWLAVSAVRQAGRFATDRDEIAATLSGEPVVALHHNNTNHAVTNLTAIPPARQSDRPFCAGICVGPS